jgi:hypothetical protein
MAALVALARIAPPRGLLTPPKTSRSLDAVVFAGFLWSVATSLPAIRTLVTDSALRLDPLTIDYATLAASLSSSLLMLAVSARFRWLRRLELGVGDRASGSLVVSAVAVLFSVPLALLNFGAPDRVVPGVLVGSSLVQCWIATTNDPTRITRWLRSLIAILALGAPVALLGSVVAQGHDTHTGWVIMAVAAWSACVGIFAKNVAKPLEPEQSRWLSAIEKATHCALEPDPTDAMRLALAELSRLNPNGSVRAELWSCDPPEAKSVDIAGQLHARAAPLPERLTELAIEEPELTLRLEVLRAVQVRRPEVRPLVSWFENQGNVSATLLQSEAGTVGMLCLPIAGRRSPLTLEEARALQRLGARIGAILAVSAAQSRSHQRELAARKRQEEVEGTLSALRVSATAEHRGYDQLTQIWANSVRRFAYSPQSRMTVEAVERQARSTAHQALVVPPGTDAKGWAALLHVASPRGEHPLIIVESVQDLETIRPWLTSSWNTEFPPRGTLVVLEPLALEKEDQQFIALRIAEVDSLGDFGCVIILHQSLTELTSVKRVHDSLARRFGSTEIGIPRLCDRSEDLRAMILDRVARWGLSLKGEPHAVDDAVLVDLLNYSWPGNDAELESTLQMLVQQAEGPLIHLEDLEAIGFCRQAGPSEPEVSTPLRSLRPPQRRVSRRPR